MNAPDASPPVAALLPHAGPMRLLDAVLGWDDRSLHARLAPVGDIRRHPLRAAMPDGSPGLPWTAALELAAQAMAAHGALTARAAARAAQGAQGAADVPGPTPGFIAAARSLRPHVDRLDGQAEPLGARVERGAGDAGQALYSFQVHDALGAVLVEGRATVVLNRSLG